MPRVQQRIMTKQRPAWQHRADEGTPITLEEIKQFLILYESLDRAEGTVQLYRRKLTQFYQALPEDKRLRHGFMERWREALLKKYKPASVNASLSAVNAFLDHIGHREYQLVGQILRPGKLRRGICICCTRQRSWATRRSIYSSSCLPTRGSLSRSCRI